MTDPRRRFGPVHGCRVCGAPVDPIQVATLDGVCGRMACRVAVRARLEGETRQIERDRRKRARALLLTEGVDPEAADWSLVPANPAEPRPLTSERRQDFAAHLRRVLDEVGAHPGADGVPDAAGVPEAEAGTHGGAVARACATCRGWCCRRGGTHAFLDARSLERVRHQHPGTTLEELERLYLDHLGATHLEGGCVYQGEVGCRLPRPLRSDTCNRWLCDDLLEARGRWRTGESDPERTRFVALPPRGPRDAS